MHCIILPKPFSAVAVPSFEHSEVVETDHQLSGDICHTAWNEGRKPTLAFRIEKRMYKTGKKKRKRFHIWGNIVMSLLAPKKKEKVVTAKGNRNMKGS